MPKILCVYTLDWHSGFIVNYNFCMNVTHSISQQIEYESKSH